MIRKLILVLIVAVGLVAIGSLFVNRLHYYHQDVKSCFNDAGGLQTGAPVRIAGVDVGTVRSVRANPQNKNCPAEVEMVLGTTYEIRIPKDSMAGIETAGLLGRAYVDIDTNQASGAPIEDYGYLKSKPIKKTLPLGDQLRAADALVRLVQALKETEKDVPDDSPPAHSPSR
ncbi:MAG: MlaD family protein [Terriglobales bacterium]